MTIDRILALPVAFLFFSAALHKLRVSVVARTVRWEPIVMAFPRIRPFAAMIYTSLVVADLVVGSALIARPRLGVLGALGLLLLYTPAGLIATRNGQDCGCFTGPAAHWFASRGRVSLIVRNVVITGICAAVAADLV